MSEQNTVPPAPQPEKAPADETPVDTTRVGEAPGAEAPVSAVPADEAPLDEARVEEAPSAARFFPGPLSRIPGPMRGKVLAVAAALVVVLGLLGLRALLSGDGTAAAKPGDCLASVDAPKEGKSGSASGATLVDCRSSDAKFTVIGRVEGKTKAEFEADAGELKICLDAGHKDAEYMYWAPQDEPRGYILCLTSKK